MLEQPRKKSNEIRVQSWDKEKPTIIFIGNGKPWSLTKNKEYLNKLEEIGLIKRETQLISVNGIKKNIPDVILNTDRDNATPAHAHFSFLGVEGESVLMSLDLEGIAVSTGSACASGSLKASHVLIAMGIKVEIAHTSIRFTLGRSNTKEEIDKTVKVLAPIIKRLRKMNPIYKK